MPALDCRTRRTPVTDRTVLAGVAVLTVAACAAIPAALAAPDPDSPSTTTTPTSAPPGGFRLDDHGFVDSAARCDDTQTAVAFGRTARGLVAICVNPDGQFEYRGVRLRDQAAVRMPAGRAADGAIVATNAGVTYAVSPEALLVSEGDTVLYRDAWVEFRQPRFPADVPQSGPTTTASTATTTTATTTTATTPTATTPTATVSTTTVTMVPRQGGN